VIKDWSDEEILNVDHELNGLDMAEEVVRLRNELRNIALGLAGPIAETAQLRRELEVARGLAEVAARQVERAIEVNQKLLARIDELERGQCKRTLDS